MEVETFNLNSNPKQFQKQMGAAKTDDELLRHKSPNSCYHLEAVMRVQKCYRGYRTRRLLADSAVVAEELWWQAIDFARLNHSTVSFFNFGKQESAASRWNRISLNASKVGKGLSLDAKAHKLAFQHWIEAIDPRHRYGHSLHIYFEEWRKADAGQPFFYWLDVGDGKEVDLKECPRSKLRQQCIKYLGPQEREHYEYIIVEGKFVHRQTQLPLDTNNGEKWIFVTSACNRLYAGEKKKGRFHHSSFLAGGVTLAAGRLDVENGTLKTISPYSGHYRPTEETLKCFLSFLTEKGVDLANVEVKKANEDYETNEYKEAAKNGLKHALPISSNTLPSETNDHEQEVDETVKKNVSYKRSLSGGLNSPKSNVPEKSILERINSKKEACSYQLGNQVSLKWSSGVGPRIGCIADYPVELRLQALDFTNLSPTSRSSVYNKRINDGHAWPMAGPSPQPTA
ncbi:IQ domain-containing protein IQM3-like [Rutidosis leptorrhynchoides]|uniref:IQ domain-containing protein IQM3-like n=1 Tax=Rutidosis leptorrhynchoides TaxID=125765 RepID=UPI003A98D4D2